MRDKTREQRKLKVRRERLRVLETAALDEVPGAGCDHFLARIVTRYCPPTELP